MPALKQSTLKYILLLVFLLIVVCYLETLHRHYIMTITDIANEYQCPGDDKCS